MLFRFFNLFLIGSTFFLKAQNIDLYITLIEKGKISEVKENLPELIERYPNDPGVLFLKGLISGDIPPTNIAATSVGIINESVLLDLCYEEDSKADADFNIVKTRDNMFIEIQGSAEGKKFSRGSIDNVLDTASQGIAELFEIQDEALKASYDTI